MNDVAQKITDFVDSGGRLLALDGIKLIEKARCWEIRLASNDPRVREELVLALNSVKDPFFKEKIKKVLEEK